ncbi:MAG TPA: phosphoribosyltransferase [Flavobacteriales bacterium]|jgi:pyrimidine operon attenuation protein/uracil phosphoribosyltransferase|nr:phosphoribosyltransferase family protein [Salibacteraceae bacterium]HAS36720.1 phosphoribosyltransferase [Flavobacteriales bacterium]
MSNRTRILDEVQVQKKIDRMAHEILENCHGEKKIILLGIARRGYSLAELMFKKLQSISSFEVVLVELKLGEKLEDAIYKGADPSDFKGHILVLIDDVLNSGTSLMKAAAGLMTLSPARLLTVVLVDRHHRLFPIRVDIVGLTLSTTMKEHIEVEFGQKPRVYLW